MTRVPQREMSIRNSSSLREIDLCVESRNQINCGKACLLSTICHGCLKPRVPVLVTTPGIHGQPAAICMDIGGSTTIES